MKKLLLLNAFKLLFLMLLTNNIIYAQVTPTFSAIAPICSGDTLSPLPTTSNNGIAGTWAPAVNNLVTTTYFFMPTAGQNANITTLTIIVNSVPAPTFNTTQPTCLNPTGKIEITSPTGAGFTYSIDGVSFQNANTFNFLPPNTYVVSVKNSLGCMSYLSIATINNPPNPINPIFSINETVCTGDVIAPLPTTSVNGVTGTWTPAIANNLATTTYTFIPSTGICANATSLTITVNPLPIIASFSTSTNVVCAGTKGILNFTGTPYCTVVYTDGTSNFSVLLDAMGNATVQTANNLTSTTTFSLVSITDNLTSCSNASLFSTVPVTIATSNGPTVSDPTPYVTLVCSGDSATTLSINATGSGLTYVWKKDNSIVPNSDSNSITVPSIAANTGNYSCSVTDVCGQTTTSSNLANIMVTAINTNLNLVGSTITSNQANATYQWIDCVNGNATIVGQNSQSFTPITNGQYAVNIQFNNCISTSECINIDFLEVDYFKGTSNIHVFPNPTASILNIQTEEKIIDLKIMDITGRTTNVSNYANNKIDVSILSSGMYFVVFKTEKGWLKEKFIKN